MKSVTRLYVEKGHPCLGPAGLTRSRLSRDRRKRESIRSVYCRPEPTYFERGWLCSGNSFDPAPRGGRQFK